MSKTIGIIGLGSIGGRHAKNLKDLGHKVLVYDPILRSGTIAQVIEESEALVIASPTKRHYDHILEAIMAKKPCFVEKPIAATEHEMNDLRRCLDPIMVGYNLRFHSCVKKAKEWLDTGKIGEPLWAHFVCAQKNEKPDYLRDGVILNWSHEIDLALYLLGPATVAGSNTTLRYGHDVATDILLTHPTCRSTIHLDYLSIQEQRFIYIVGTGGDIFIDVPPRYAIIRGDTEDSAYPFTGKDSFDENYIEEMQAFIDRIDGKETIGCTGEEGLEVLKICLEVRKQAGLP